MSAKTQPGERTPRAILVMGVTGSGKTTVGRALASTIGATFVEADDFHPPSNVEKMSRGEPLTDADRRPWLDRLNEALRTEAGAGRDAVVACSALKEAYRERLFRGVPAEVRVVHLQGEYGTLHERMRSREHFMPPSLLQSQIETLEPPGDAIVVDVRRPVADIVESLAVRLHEAG